MSIKIIALFFLFLLIESSIAVEITLHKRNAVVWGQQQLIQGEIDTLITTNGVLYLNGDPITFSISGFDNSFSVPIRLSRDTSYIVVRVDSSGVPFYSDSLQLILGYRLRPEVFVYPSVNGNSVTLISEIIENPDSVNLSYRWEEDPSNAVSVTFTSSTDSITSFTLPSHSPLGEYYYNLHVSTPDGQEVTARTLVTLDSTGITPFDIYHDHVKWIDKAVIYQVTPYNFVLNGKLQDVVAKLAELAELGVNTIYLQPIFQTHNGGQGYDVINYFKMRSDYGPESHLRLLMINARYFGLKVIIDFVPNHSSFYHPYAQESIQYGTDSHYYNFYQRDLDNASYSMHYHLDPHGFIYYFWPELPNLNYDNPEVQKWMIEACKYWIEKYDIDGYRFDAAWGVNARNPQFMQELRLALKRIKPEILLLGEDKATWPMVFDQRFDVAYDWGPTEQWVSQWSYQTNYSTSNNYTVFNSVTPDQRSHALRKALTNNGNGYHPRAKILRFMENNDTFRFIQHHGVERTKMAAAFFFTLHGVPMMYNGQEVGFTTHPYYTSYVYTSYQTIKSLDFLGFFPFYQKLIQIRKNYSAFTSDNFREVSVTPAGHLFAYRRWEGNQNAFVIINLADISVTATFYLPVDSLDLDPTSLYYLCDVNNGDIYSGNPAELSMIEIPMNPYMARIFILADTVVSVNFPSLSEQPIPARFELQQNYPNPFNPLTKIVFSIPRTDKISLTIYDILGRKVIAPVNSVLTAGEHELWFNGEQLPSGVYVYRLEMGSKSISRKMILIR